MNAGLIVVILLISSASAENTYGQYSTAAPTVPPTPNAFSTPVPPLFKPDAANFRTFLPHRHRNPFEQSGLFPSQQTPYAANPVQYSNVVPEQNPRLPLLQRMPFLLPQAYSPFIGSNPFEVNRPYFTPSYPDLSAAAQYPYQPINYFDHPAYNAKDCPPGSQIDDLRVNPIFASKAPPYLVNQPYGKPSLFQPAPYSSSSDGTYQSSNRY